MRSSVTVFISLLLVLICQIPISAQIYISGSLRGVMHPETYIVEDSIYVEAGNTLVIEPGCDLQFAGYFNFRIFGKLTAVGTETDSIFFHPGDGVDSIRTIIFQQGSSDSSRMSYCHVSGCAESAINMYYVDIEISHCTITGNTANWGGGIYSSHADATISDCVITNNICGNNGGGIYCTGANPIIANCIVNGNLCNTAPTTSSGMGGGGICANHSASPVITNCTVVGNRSLWHGGAISINDNSHPVISYCLLAENSCDSSGGGLAVFTNCTPEIVNCTIVNDTTANYGGAVYIRNATPKIRNSIMSHCVGEGGLYFENPDTTEITYCDIYNPETDNFAGMVPEGLGQLVTVNTNNDSCDQFSNLLFDPLFMDLAMGDYHLIQNSPCIDAGDPESPYDPDGTVVDIGVYYYSQTGPPAMTVTLTYVSGSPVPDGGGDIHFSLYVENEDVIALDFSGWLELAYEGGNPTTVALRDFTGFPSGASISRPDMVFPVPAAYTAGNYTFTGKVGDYPDIIWDESGFPFVKSGLAVGAPFEPWIPADFQDPFGEEYTNEPGAVKAFNLVSAYPNPFNPTTSISFNLPTASDVELTVFDVNGRRVGVGLAPTRWYNAGHHALTFNGSDLPSGIYFYRLTAGQFTGVGKLVLMK